MNSSVRNGRPATGLRSVQVFLSCIYASLVPSSQRRLPSVGVAGFTQCKEKKLLYCGFKPAVIWVKCKISVLTVHVSALGELLPPSLTPSLGKLVIAG